MTTSTPTPTSSTTEHPNGGLGLESRQRPLFTENGPTENGPDTGAQSSVEKTQVLGEQVFGEQGYENDQIFEERPGKENPDQLASVLPPGSPTGKAAAGGLVEPVRAMAHGGRLGAFALPKIGSLINAMGGADVLKCGGQFLTVSSLSFAIGNSVALIADHIPRLGVLEFFQNDPATQLAAQSWNTVTINLLWAALGAVLWCLAIKNGPIDRFLIWARRKDLTVLEQDRQIPDKKTPEESKWVKRLRARLIPRGERARARNRRWNDIIWNGGLVIVAGIGLWGGVVVGAARTGVAIEQANMSTIVPVSRAVAALDNVQVPDANPARVQACMAANMRANDILQGNEDSGSKSRLSGLVLGVNEKVLYVAGCQDGPTLAKNLEILQIQVAQAPSLVIDRWPLFPGSGMVSKRITAMAERSSQMDKAEWTRLQASRLSSELGRTKGAPLFALSVATQKLMGNGTPAVGVAEAKSFMGDLIAHPKTQVLSAEALAPLLVHAPMKNGEQVEARDDAVPVTVEQVRRAMVLLPAAETAAKAQATKAQATTVQTTAAATKKKP